MSCHRATSMRVEVKVVAGPAAGRTFTFDEPDCMLFGRSDDARISISGDPFVSRHHFLLEISPPVCKVTDLGSKNGVYVNGVRYGGRKPPSEGVVQAPDSARETMLEDGDEIAVGDTRMRVSISSTRAAADETLTHAPPAQVKAPAADPATGATVATDSGLFDGYSIETELGRGGMGVVYKAVQVATGRHVAIKTMLPQVATDETAVRVFLREVEVTRQLVHPNVVQLLDHGRVKGTFYFVLEFVDGTDLCRWLESRGGRVPLEVLAPLMTGILDGLAHAHRASLEVEVAAGDRRVHRGTVHRDLKPENILLGRAGDGWVPKVADFGLSKSFESAGLTDITVPGMVAGSPLYWPREQITHYRYLDPATDVFSIAAVFYEALTGFLVRDGLLEMLDGCQRVDRQPGISDFLRVILANRPVPIRERDPGIPGPVAQVLDRALQETEVPHGGREMRTLLAKLRYPDAGAFRDALVEALEQAGYRA